MSDEPMDQDPDQSVEELASDTADEETALETGDLTPETAEE